MKPYFKYIAIGLFVVSILLLINLFSEYLFWNEVIFLACLSVSAYLIIFQSYHFFYLKKLIFIRSFNWFSIIPFLLGVYKLFVPEDYYFFGSFLQSNYGYSFSLILLSITSLPRYMILSKHHIKIYLMDGKIIKYPDIINIDFKNGIVLFETTESSFQISVFKYNTEMITKLRWSLNKNEALLKAKSNIRNANIKSSIEM